MWVSDCIDPLERQQINRGTVQLIPPELMGSHVASPRSHSTGRMHDLSFRAGTALLGHFGVEWDLTRADDSDLADLRAWVVYYKAHRRELFTGRVVRVDTGDETLNVYGVVATPPYGDVPRRDRRPGHRQPPPAAVPARARPGAGVPDHTGAGGRRPVWPDRTCVVGGSHTESSVTRYEGIVLPGSVLMGSGVQPPSLDPEQIVIYELQAAEGEQR